MLDEREGYCSGRVKVNSFWQCGTVPVGGITKGFGFALSTYRVRSYPYGNWQLKGPKGPLSLAGEKVEEVNGRVSVDREEVNLAVRYPFGPQRQTRVDLFAETVVLTTGSKREASILWIEYWLHRNDFPIIPLFSEV
jgi:hypothetical protein